MSKGSAHLFEPSLPQMTQSFFASDGQEARAVHGRLEYQRGNFEAALLFFEGLDIAVLVPRFRYFASDKARHRRFRARSETALTACLHTANLLFEAIYLKAKCLQKLGRFEGTRICLQFLHMGSGFGLSSSPILRYRF